MAPQIHTVNVDEQGKRLTKPFTMIDLLDVDELSVSVFLCQGTLPWHRHVDHDELFLTYNGAINLETEWGSTVLRPGELTQVPKAVAHRSSSLLPSLVLLFHPVLLSDRRNGHRQLFVDRGRQRIEKVSLPALARQIVRPFVPIVVASVGHYWLHLTLVVGEGPWWGDPRQGALVYPIEGQLLLESRPGRTPLQVKEMASVPAGIPYRLVSAQRATVLGARRRPDPTIEGQTFRE